MAEEKALPNKVDYEDCANQGHLTATWKAEHICLRCLLSRMCALAVAANQIGYCFPAVSRCLMFTAGGNG